MFLVIRRSKELEGVQSTEKLRRQSCSSTFKLTLPRKICFVELWRFEL